MTQFELVNQLISNSSSEATKSLKSMIKLNDDGDGSAKSKSELLVEHFLKYKTNADEKVVCKKIYGNHDDKSLKALGKLLMRLKDKIYENLLLDKNLYRSDSFSELRIAKSELQKSILLCNVLDVISNKEEIEKICDKVIAKGKEYELYNELLSAFEIKYNIVSTNNDKQGLHEIDKEMSYYDRCRSSLFKAKKTYDELLIDLNLKTGSSNPELLRQAVVELEHEYRFTQSANIMYYLHLYSIHYYQSLEEYDRSEEHCNQLIDLVKSNKAVYLHSRLGVTFLQLAKNNLLSYSFNDALSIVKKANDYCKTKPANLFRLKEIEFLANYYSGRVSEAKNLLTELGSLSEGLTSIETAKCSFYNAAVSFLLEDTKTVNQHLNDITDIEKDKDGWNIGIRILNILNLLKSEKFELVESKIESLRKHIERSERVEEVSPRNRLIFQILLELGRSSYNYEEVYEVQEESFELLSSYTNQYKWSVKSPELIRFHDWFKAKAKNQAYELRVGKLIGKKENEEII
ncbi:MAG: hypothetical protein HKO56_06745 [Bacteroidia bacterium]|nr:hypothetical protein [Bacteroidia bacterium]